MPSRNGRSRARHSSLREFDFFDPKENYARIWDRPGAKLMGVQFVRDVQENHRSDDPVGECCSLGAPSGKACADCPCPGPRPRYHSVSSYIGECQIALHKRLKKLNHDDPNEKPKLYAGSVPKLYKGEVPAILEGIPCRYVEDEIDLTPVVEIKVDWHDVLRARAFDEIEQKIVESFRLDKKFISNGRSQL